MSARSLGSARVSPDRPSPAGKGSRSAIRPGGRQASKKEGMGGAARPTIDAGSRVKLRPMGAARGQELAMQRALEDEAKLGALSARSSGSVGRAYKGGGVRRVYSTKDADPHALLKASIMGSESVRGPKAGDAASVVESVATDDDEDPEKRRRRKAREAIKARLARERANQGCIAWIKRKWKAERVIRLSDAAYDAAVRVFFTPANIRTLKNMFDGADLDGMGSIDIDEFLDLIDEPYGPFQYALLRIIGKEATADLEGEEDPDALPPSAGAGVKDDEETKAAAAAAGHGDIVTANGLVRDRRVTFDEMVILLATYAVFTKQQILDYCFNTFDQDGSGTIDEKEFMSLAKWLNTKTPTFPGNFRKALEEFDVDADGCLSFQEFQELGRRYPLLLFPAFKCQESMHKYCLGEEEWTLIFEDLARADMIKQYRRTHGGAFPPESRQDRLKRLANGRPNLYSGKSSLPPQKPLEDLSKKRVRKAKKKH